MKPFWSFINEQYLASLKAVYRNSEVTDIYINPTSSDMVKLNARARELRNYDIRFIAVNRGKKLLVWNGLLMNHSDAAKQLSNASVIKIKNIYDIEECFTGTALLLGGEMVYSRSDTYDMLFDYMKMNKRLSIEFESFPQRTEDLIRRSPEKYLEMYDFIGDYMSEFDGENNALVKISDLY